METLKELVSRVLEIDKSEINDNSSPENIKSWDSFKGLLMISELEKNFNVKFTVREVMEVVKFSDICNALKRHGITEGANN